MSQGQRVASAAFFLVAVAIVAAAAIVTIYLPGSEMARSPFLLLCHGRVERAFILAGAAMPICARCVGIYAGIAMATLSIPLLPVLRRRLDTSLLVIAILPLLIDGATQATGLRESNNALRFATGIIAAFAFVVWAISRMGDDGESVQQKVA